jgi:DNA polymerase-1
MMQLVNDDVVILNPTKDNLILDRAGVEQNLGVPPERVVDVMALRGDSIDNIPGAPGIGDKGSVELIQQFGSVEAALDRADEVKKKTYRESLQNNRENILLSKELVTIHTGVPIEYSLEAMRTQSPDNAACRELFSELEFTTLLKELAPAVDNTAVAYNLKPTDAEIAKLLAEARKVNPDTELPRGLAIFLAEDARAVSEEIAIEPDPEGVDAEPGAVENMSLFGVPPDPAIPFTGAAVPDRACTLGLAVADYAALEAGLDQPAVREALADPKLPKDLHDLKAVLRALAPHNVTLAGVRDDVMLLSYLVNPTHGSHTLPDIAARTTSRALTHQPTKDNPTDPKRLPEAAAAIVRLASALRKQIAEAGSFEHHIIKDDPSLGGALTKEMLFAAPVTAKAVGTSPLFDVYNTIDKPLVPVLLRMEQVGVRIDSTVLGEMSNRLAVEIDNLGERIYTQAGAAMGAESGHRFNINSPKQLGDVLFNKMLLPKPMKYGKGKVVSTAQDVLEELAEQHPVPALVLEYRQLAKLKSTYLDSLPQLTDAQGRVHTTFNQVGTATGRLSSTNPNLQNIPIRTALGREIRAAFISAPGNVLMSADYSQIELRLMAHFSQDPLLLDAYRTGKDIHTLTASEVFGVDAATMDKETRARAKAVNFGIVYGISPFGLAAQLNIDQKTAKQYIETYFDRYKGVQRFIEETLETVRRDQSVKTHFGRIRPIPDIRSRNPNMRGFAERTAINTPLQGTAADLIKLAMLKIDQLIRDRKLKSQMTLQVHDELLFDVVPEEVEELRGLVKREMEHVAEFSIPIVADVGIGQNWREIK